MWKYLLGFDAGAGRTKEISSCAVKRRVLIDEPHSKLEPGPGQQLSLPLTPFIEQARQPSCDP